MTAKLELGKVQEQVEDVVKQAQEVGRKAYLSYLGVWGMGYDGAKALYKDPMGWMEKAEQRGKSVEKELMKVLEAYREDPRGEVTKLAESVQETATDMGKKAGHMAEEWAKTAEKTIAKYARRDNPVMEAVEEIAVEARSMVKNLNGGARKGAEKVADKAAVVMEDVKEAAASAVDAIWKGYDELGVKDIVAGLEGMDVAKLEEIRKYEVGGKNRVTVVREIDARLQAMTS